MATYVNVAAKLIGGKLVDLEFTNHRGIRSVRRVEPQRIWFGSTEWHQDPQWLMDVFDLDREAIRTVAMRDICAFD